MDKELRHQTVNPSQADARIIRRHYGLSRMVTDAEVRAEFDMLRRRAASGSLYDSQEALAAELGII